MRLSGPIVALVLFACPLAAGASDLLVPTLALDGEQFSILSDYRESADGMVNGAGSRLRITYHSSTPLNAFIAPMIDDTAYNPAQMYRFVLPATSLGTENIDLTALSSWSPAHTNYYLSFLSGKEETDAEFSEMTIHGGSFFTTVSAAFFQLWQSEPYWVSNAHLLRGYFILGIPFSVVFGLLTIIVATAFFVRKKRQLAITILLMGVLLYNLRFGIDLLRYSVTHVREWETSHTYGEPQDLYEVADALNAMPNVLHVSVCFDSTDYYAKLLRYLLYPTNVHINQSIEKATHVVVTRKIDWDYTNGILRCGTSFTHAATKLKEFPSGSIIFSLTQS